MAKVKLGTKSKSKKNSTKTAKKRVEELPKKGKTSSTVKLSKVAGKKKKKKKVEEEEKELKRNISAKAKKRHIESEDEEDDDAVLEDEEDVLEDEEEIDEDDESDNSEDDDSEDEEDSEADEDEDEDEDSESDFGELDAGPDPKKVPFGNNCASCKMFVKWDDPIREDPEWLEKMEATKHRCPKLLGPQEFDTSDRDPQDFVAQADDEACGKYVLNDEKAPEHFIEALNNVKGNFTIPEFHVLMLSAQHILRGKELEREMGYRYGQTVPVMLKGDGDRGIEVKAKVFDFQKKKGKEVIVRGIHPKTGKPFKAVIPAVRAVEVVE